MFLVSCILFSFKCLFHITLLDPFWTDLVVLNEVKKGVRLDSVPNRLLLFLSPVSLSLSSSACVLPGGVRGP